MADPIEVCPVGGEGTSCSESSEAFSWSVEGAVSDEAGVHHVYAEGYTLSWTSVSGASVYYLQRKEGEGEWEDVNTPSGEDVNTPSGEEGVAFNGLSSGSFNNLGQGSYSYRLQACAGPHNCTEYEEEFPVLPLVFHDLSLYPAEEDSEGGGGLVFEGVTGFEEIEEDGVLLRYHLAFVDSYALLWRHKVYPAGVRTYYKVERREGASRWQEIGMLYPDSDAQAGDVLTHESAQYEAGDYSYRVTTCVSRSNFLGIVLGIEDYNRCAFSDPVAIHIKVQDERNLPQVADLRSETDPGVPLVSYDASPVRKIFYIGENKSTAQMISMAQYQVAWSPVAGAKSYRVYERKDQGSERDGPVARTTLKIPHKTPGIYRYTVVPCIDNVAVARRCASKAQASSIEVDVRDLSTPILASVILDYASQDGANYSLALASQTLPDFEQRFYYEVQEKSVAETEDGDGEWESLPGPRWDGLYPLSIRDHELGLTYEYRARLCLSPLEADSSADPLTADYCSSWSESVLASMEISSVYPPVPNERFFLYWETRPFRLSWGFGSLPENSDIVGYCMEEKRCGGAHDCTDEDNWRLTGARSGTPPTAGSCGALWIAGGSSSSFEVSGRVGPAFYRYRIKKCSQAGNCSVWSDYGSVVEFVGGLPTPRNLRSSMSVSFDGSYDILWDDVTHAMRYGLEESVDGGVNWVPLRRDAYGQSQEHFDNTPAPVGHEHRYGNSYSYRVRACLRDGSSVCSHWAEGLPSGTARAVYSYHYSG